MLPELARASHGASDGNSASPLPIDTTVIVPLPTPATSKMRPTTGVRVSRTILASGAGQPCFTIHLLSTTHPNSGHQPHLARPVSRLDELQVVPEAKDAVPKKRGPKTDVLEALLKRVDGLEAKLKEKNDDYTSQTVANGPTSAKTDTSGSGSQAGEGGEPAPKRIALDTRASPCDTDLTMLSPQTHINRELSPNAAPADTHLDTYFTRFHGKPYYILDESSVRQRLQLNQLPKYLSYAISAVAARYTPHPSGYQAATRLSDDFATRVRREISTDDPSIDALQALLLLVSAFTASGRGKKAYMLMTSATGMAMALEIHREKDSQARMTPVEREMRRRLFWTCYLLDRFQATGSKRPCLISDNSILLRLPCWSPNSLSLPVEGEFFQAGSNLQYFQASGKKPQGSTGMLIDITRILGITNRYLAAGGVKGDSHFPWHSLSSLSKIRYDLDIWASGTEDVFSSLNTLFGQADSTVLVLSKLIYHLIHCLIYRPFLPIDLAELAEIGQHQSWQIEATNMCFLHANAIAELIEFGKQTGTIEWPAFAGYCICTAGTVHIHGAHYSEQGGNGEVNVFSSSADFLSREMQQLSELRYAWACVQHQRETLQGIYNAHGELVKTLAQNSMRYTSGFHSENFFDRYSNIGGPGGQSFSFDAANLSLSDVVVDFTTDSYTGHELYTTRVTDGSDRPNLKRKSTSQITRKRPEVKVIASLTTSASGPPTPANPRRSFSYTAGMVPPVISWTTRDPNAVATPPGDARKRDTNQRRSSGSGRLWHVTHNAPRPGQGMPASGGAPFSPAYSYASGSSANHNGATVINVANGGYDAMSGTLPTNAFSSPAAWHSEEQQHHHAKLNHTPTMATAPSPGNRSNNGSIGTGQGKKKGCIIT
ncbi:fungal-specific transcription factor domain-containing protein [Ilyonectria destructans]|nr:fungal-specific transcription factor domain-containing protein [Ilyonectria destructans]